MEAIGVGGGDIEWASVLLVLGAAVVMDGNGRDTRGGSDGRSSSSDMTEWDDDGSGSGSGAGTGMVSGKSVITVAATYDDATDDADDIWESRN